MVVRVHLIRHGEVENPAGVVYGRLPGFFLSDRGRRQAEAAAAALRASGAEVGRIISSPLERARESAAPLAEAFGLGIETNDAFLEATSRLQGRAYDVSLAILAHPEAWRFLLNPARPSWGEPYRDVLARMLRGIRDLTVASDASGRDVAIVSHQLPIWMVSRHASGKPLIHDPRKRRCAHSSITTVEVDGPVVRHVRYLDPFGSR